MLFAIAPNAALSSLVLQGSGSAILGPALVQLSTLAASQQATVLEQLIPQLVRQDPPEFLLTSVRSNAARIRQGSLQSIETTLLLMLNPYDELIGEIIDRLPRRSHTTDIGYRELGPLILGRKLYGLLLPSERILLSLVRVLEAKDRYTRGHSDRVAAYAVDFAKALRLTPHEQEEIRKGAFIHDIGKISTRKSVLHKPQRGLTEEEERHMQEHPVRGYELCYHLVLSNPVLLIIRYHHERWDGQGYPDGLAGEEIPLPARIVSIADSYDAITSDRPYRKGVRPPEALEIFRKERDGGQWDPRLIDEFVRVMRSRHP